MPASKSASAFASPDDNAADLKQTGLKATLPRLKILEVFQKGDQRHMTAEDVFRVLLNDRTDIGLATVYRVLMQFEQAGLLTRSQFDSGKAVYELNEGQHHDHLVCLDCGRVL
jgi:Fur family transcriptional regulator, ferric uptake regulator